MLPLPARRYERRRRASRLSVLRGLPSGGNRDDREGRESTSVTHSSFVSLPEKGVAEILLTMGLSRVASPTENAESFRQFARWMDTTERDAHMNGV